MKNNEIFRELKLFPGVKVDAVTEDTAAHNDAPVLGEGTVKTQGLANGIP